MLSLTRLQLQFTKKKTKNEPGRMNKWGCERAATLKKNPKGFDKRQLWPVFVSHGLGYAGVGVRLRRTGSTLAACRAKKTIKFQGT